MSFEANIEEIQKEIDKGNYQNALESLQILKHKTRCRKCVTKLQKIENQLLEDISDNFSTAELEFLKNYKPMSFKDMFKPKITPFMINRLKKRVKNIIKPCKIGEKNDVF